MLEQPSVDPVPGIRFEGRRRRRPWLAAWIVLAVGLLLAGLWFLLGGLPFSDHDRHGSVSVPGTGEVELPTGDVRVFFQESDLSGDESATVPEGVEVTVVGPTGSPVPISKTFGTIGGISVGLSSTTIGVVGHTDYGRMAVLTAGAHSVTVTQASATGATDPTITFGEPPLNPFGPPIVGAAIIFAPFVLIAVLLLLIWRR
jgi:hypothetical protein